MHTGWIDVHGHFSLPRDSHGKELMAKALTEENFLFTPDSLDWRVEANLDHMDRHGIALQLLSSQVPQSAEDTVKSNDYGDAVVNKYPDRFALLASLPLGEPDRTVAEIRRCWHDLNVAGFTIQSNYDGIYLGDRRFDPVWTALEEAGATVFLHPRPRGFQALGLGRPTSFLEVTFDTARTVVDMLFAGVFRRHPNINFVLAHAGGALPALAERVATLGTAGSIPNPEELTAEEIRATLSRLYYDTGLAATEHSLAPALAVTTSDHIVYGSDYGAVCTCDGLISSNMDSVRRYERLSAEERDAIGHNALRIFPRVAERLANVDRSQRVASSLNA
jgi:predicted TIM-barrel fold metal-dependent hydrolase